MEAGPQRNRAVGVTVAAVVVLAASFMPWGEIRGGGAGLFGAMFERLGLSLTVTAWNGSITVLGVKIPNWLIVVAAAGAAVVAWLKVAHAWEPPAALLYGLAGYGLFHSVWVVLALMFSSRGSVEIGSLLTAPPPKASSVRGAWGSREVPFTGFRYRSSALVGRRAAV